MVDQILLLVARVISVGGSAHDFNRGFSTRLQRHSTANVSRLFDRIYWLKSYEIRISLNN
jgi:hypothetical protein